MTHPAPHDGEMRPDSDEVLYLIRVRRLNAVLEEDETQGVVEMTPGQTLIVPNRVWHGVLAQAEPAASRSPTGVTMAAFSRTPFEDGVTLAIPLVQFRGLDVQSEAFTR